MGHAARGKGARPQTDVIFRRLFVRVVIVLCRPRARQNARIVGGFTFRGVDPIVHSYWIAGGVVGEDVKAAYLAERRR
jgi:hypothetical protein